MNQATQQAMIDGGKPVSILHLDGTQESAKIQLLKVRQFREYLELIDDDESLAAFFCGKELTWSDSLTPESMLTINEIGHDLNFRNACRWGKRKAGIGEALIPMAQSAEKVQSALPNFARTAD